MAIIQIPTREILFGPAPIDWCEANHPESNPFHWQELHNTWTNVAYLVVGLMMAVAHIQQKAPTDPLYLLSCLCCFMTGIASAWFHATLIYIAQKTDEFFENAMVVALIYVMVFPIITPSAKIVPSRGPTRYLACCLHFVLLAIGMIFIPQDFAEIHLAISVLLYFWKLTERANWITTDPVTQRKVLGQRNWAFFSTLASFALWGVDRAHCTPFVQGLHLHAFAWHWGTAWASAVGSSALMVILESYHMTSLKMP